MTDQPGNQNSGAALPASRSADSDKNLQTLLELFKTHAPVFVLSGAGISLASGLGTYRNDAGQWTRQEPIKGPEFIADGNTRQRYWARSFVGWPSVEKAQPSASHTALAKLQQHNLLTSLVTQNVDGLHTLAGHQGVIDLHGNLHRVKCLRCSVKISRADFQQRLLRENPVLERMSGTATTDGDSDALLASDSLEGTTTAAGAQTRKESIEAPGAVRARRENVNPSDSSQPLFPADQDHLTEAAIRSLQIPACQACGGILKPDVVFFAENVAADVVDAAFESLQQAGSMLVVGSSLMIYSGFRFARAASEQNKPLVLLNRGVTRADALTPLKISAECDPLLTSLAAHF